MIKEMDSSQTNRIGWKKNKDLERECAKLLKESEMITDEDRFRKLLISESCSFDDDSSLPREAFLEAMMGCFKQEDIHVFLYNGHLVFLPASKTGRSFFLKAKNKRRIIDES